MVCLGAVGFALSVVCVLEFDSACWAVCDAYLLCSCEYLFSELFVFFCACSAHSCFLFLPVSVCCCVFVVCVRWGRVAASARRAPPPSNTTLLLSSSAFRSSLLFFVCVSGVCCVVRAQPCEHARDTTRATCVLVCLPCVVCVTSATTWCLLSPPHTVHC